MSPKKKYQLISGIFNTKDALSIVMNFYNNKINYHNVQLLTAMEHNDSNVGLIQQKITSLQSTCEEIKKLLMSGVAHNQQVEVNGFIEIKLDPIKNG